MLFILAPAVDVALGVACKNIDKSIELDEKAVKRLRKAYSLQHMSKVKIENALENHNIALAKLLTRKVAITQYSLKPFLDVFNKIIRIELDDKLIENSKIEITFPKEKYGNLMIDHNIVIKPFTGKEALVSLLKGGLPGLMIDDSKRNMAIAGKHLRIAESYANNAENICTMTEHIIQEANKVSDLLGALNIILLRAIKNSNDLIHVRGFNKNNYSEEDREILRNTINIAKVIKDIIDSPVLDDDGIINNQLKDCYCFAKDFYMRLNEGI